MPLVWYHFCAAEHMCIKNKLPTITVTETIGLSSGTMSVHLVHSSISLAVSILRKLYISTRLDAASIFTVSAPPQSHSIIHFIPQINPDCCFFF